MKTVKFRRPFFKAEYPYEFCHFVEWGVGLNGHYFVSPTYNNSCTNKDDQMFTGLFDRNGREIYEGDIRREEEEHEWGDTRDYYVMTYINEWSMFAWLHLPGEYNDYLDNGVEYLDTTMFWTYPAQKDEENKIVICGNIYKNPELLK